MTLKTLSIDFQKILQSPHLRLDAKYFLVNDFFDNLSKKSDARLELLENLKTEIVSGSYIPEYTNQKEGIPYLRVADIKPFSFDENKEDLVYVSASVPEKIKTKENDILIARTQATIDKLGIASIVDKEITNWATSQHTTRIRVNQNKISPFYLTAYFNSKFFKKQMALASHGDTRVELTHSQLNQVRVFVPPQPIYDEIVEKTKKIVEYNRQANILIEKAITEFREKLGYRIEPQKTKFFSADFQQLKEFDIWNPMSHLPFFTENERILKTKHQTVLLSEICDIKKGDEVGSDNYQTYLEKHDNDFAFIRTSDIINHEIDLFPDYFVTEQIGKNLAQNLQSGDILFSKDGKIGQCAILTKDDKVIIASGLVRLRLKNSIQEQFNLTPEFIFTTLATKEIGFYQSIRRMVIGTTIPHLREERLKQINIPLFPNEIIHSISEKIKVAFELKSLRKQNIFEVLKSLESLIDF